MNFKNTNCHWWQPHSNGLKLFNLNSDESVCRSCFRYGNQYYSCCNKIHRLWYPESMYLGSPTVSIMEQILSDTRKILGLANVKALTKFVARQSYIYKRNSIVPSCKLKIRIQIDHVQKMKKRKPALGWFSNCMGDTRLTFRRRPKQCFKMFSGLVFIIHSTYFLKTSFLLKVR